MTHEEFVERYYNSLPAVRLVARWFQSLGHYVWIPESEVAPTMAEAKEYRDRYDLLVIRNDRPRLIEVKHVGVNFTCRDDWEFKDKFIICDKAVYDSREFKPWLHIIVSNDLTHAATVHNVSAEHWFAETRPNKNTGGSIKPYYFCPIGLVHFEKIPVAP